MAAALYAGRHAGDQVSSGGFQSTTISLWIARHYAGEGNALVELLPTGLRGAQHELLLRPGAMLRILRMAARRITVEAVGGGARAG